MWNHSFLFGSLIHCPSRSPRNRCIFIMDLFYFWKLPRGKGKLKSLVFVNRGMFRQDIFGFTGMFQQKKISSWIGGHRNMYSWLYWNVPTKIFLLNWQTQKHLSLACWPSPNLVRSPGNECFPTHSLCWHQRSDINTNKNVYTNTNTKVNANVNTNLKLKSKIISWDK